MCGCPEEEQISRRFREFLNSGMCHACQVLEYNAQTCSLNLLCISYDLPGLLPGDAAHQEKRWRDPDRPDVCHAQVLSSPPCCLCSLPYKFFDIFFCRFLWGDSLTSPIPSRSSPSIYFGPKSNRLMELGIDSERFVNTLCLNPGYLHNYIIKAMR